MLFFLESLSMSQKSVHLQCVFHSIRFKVNKGWSTAVLLFLCPKLNFGTFFLYFWDQRIFQVGNPIIYQAYCVPLLYESRTVTPCHPPGCAYR